MDDNWASPSRAISLVGAAIKSGNLVRSSHCELCGRAPESTPIMEKRGRSPILYAHHWNGYNNPLDVWFICRSCNGVLNGKYFHSGQVSKDEARQYVIMRRQPPLVAKRCAHICANGERCKRMLAKSEYCRVHDPNIEQHTCQGLTKNGLPCRKRVSNGWRYCSYLHRPNQS